jgi:hypothetical protein
VTRIPIDVSATGAVTVRLVIVALLMLAQSTAHAVDRTGAELQQACNAAKGTQEYRVCAAYVGGVLDGMWASQKLLAIGRKSCVPRLSDGDAIAVVMKYLKLRPDSLADHIASIVSASLETEFGCK